MQLRINSDYFST